MSNFESVKVAANFTPYLLSAAQTHVGRVRASNEDRWAISSQHSPLSAHKGYLYVVADGIGGHMGGGVAAELAIGTLMQAFDAEMLDEVTQLTSPEAIDNTVETATAKLGQWIAAAHTAILEAQSQTPAHASMGTTIVAVMLLQSKLIVANVGDSRCYLLHNAVIQQLSVDHSWVAEQVRAGAMTAAKAKLSRNRSMVLRALGSPDNATPDISVYDWHDGDRILLCSDGLWGMINEQRIAELLPNGPPTQAAEALLNAALLAGGEDNITVLVAGQMPTQPSTNRAAVLVSTEKPAEGNASPFPSPDSAAVPKPSAPRRLVMFIALLASLCIGGAGLVWGTNMLRNTTQGGWLASIFGNNPILAPIVGGNELPKNSTVVVIPAENWAQVSPIPGTPPPLVLPTLTNTPDKPTATLTPTLTTSVATTRPFTASTNTPVTPKIVASVTPSPSPIVVLLATITPPGGIAPPATVAPVIPTPIRAATVTAIPSPTVALNTNTINSARLCSASAVLIGTCFSALPPSREFIVQDNEIYLYWPAPLPKGTLLRVQWLHNSRPLGAADNCVLGDQPCANFDVTANYARLRLKDIQGDKTGAYGYKAYISDRLVIEGDFIVR